MINFYVLHNGMLDNPEMQHAITQLSELSRREAISISQQSLQPVLHLIKKSPYLIFIYAADILQERWLEAEHILLNTKPDFEFVYSSMSTCFKVYMPNVIAWYARDVMRCRWGEAEELIKHTVLWPNYVEWFDISLICNGK